MLASEDFLVIKSSAARTAFVLDSDAGTNDKVKREMAVNVA